MKGLTDTAAMAARRGGFPYDLQRLASHLGQLREVAARGPCVKSKRGALLVSSTRPSRELAAADHWFAVNSPAGGCTGDAACRSACPSLCNHAEERAVLTALRYFAAGSYPAMHVLHLAVDAAGVPRSKVTPSCVTCSRLMFEAGVEAVWLFGLHDIPAPSTALGRWLIADDDRLARFRSVGVSSTADAAFCMGLEAAIGLPDVTSTPVTNGLGTALTWLLAQRSVREVHPLRDALYEALGGRHLSTTRADLQGALVGEMRWKAWPMLQFHIETLRNNDLPVSPALAHAQEAT